LNAGAGLGAAFLSNKQPIANKVDSQLANNIITYYISGSSENITNRAVMLQVPLNIDYVFNPMAKTNFFAGGGFSFEYMLSNKWLIADKASNQLYYQKSL